jgi:hypothetical protein
LKINGMNNENFCISSLKSTDKVADLKLAVSKGSGLVTNTFRLIYANCNLDDANND